MVNSGENSKMKYRELLWLLILTKAMVQTQIKEQCGCKEIRPCYQKMLDELKVDGEASCIRDDTAIGSSTVTIFLSAIKTYCPDIFNFWDFGTTFDGRAINQVAIFVSNVTNTSLPVIVIDAGQDAAKEPVRLALYVMERLVACNENADMIENIYWVIMPSVNPDGQEYARFRQYSAHWKKNCKVSSDKRSIGVDITRNFNTSEWSSCDKDKSGFSPNYPGPEGNSESETIAITKILQSHFNMHPNVIYLTVKRNGHSIGYPYAFSNKAPTNIGDLRRIAGDIAARVNRKTSEVQWFSDDSLYALEGRPHCGHSVDYAYEMGIKLSFEMRVFMESNNEITSLFHTQPRDYKNMLLEAYFNGIKALYDEIVVKQKAKRYRP